MPPPPPPGSWQPQVVVVKQRSGCLTAFLIAVGVAILAAIGLFLLFAVALDKAAEKVEDSVGIAAIGDYDIALTSCAPDAVSHARASGTIENLSDKRQGFRITVRFTTPDNTLIAEESAHVDALEVGQTGTWTVVSFAKATADVACTIDRVNYTIFDNEE